jgi:TRAP-type uncharacterized transport system fused permease subunit
MGIVAFAISGFAGISYWTICKMAIIPALLYYGCIMLYSHLQAMKTPQLRNRSTEKPQVNFDLLKWRASSFIVPFGLIIYMLARGIPVTRTACYAIIAVIVCSYATKKEYRPKIKKIIAGFSSGAIDGAKMACCCACIGTLVTTFGYSGLSVKLASSIQTISGGSLFIVIIIIYIISIIAGMCGVAAAAYFTIAVFSVSVLTNMGISYNVAHFFSAYPSFFATLTPPVALVSLLASKMAGTKYGSTALESCKVSITGFIMPFFFCYAPAICLSADMSDIWSWVDIGVIVFGSLVLQVFWCRYMFTRMNFIEMAIAGATVVLLFLFIGQSYLFMLVGGAAGCAVLLVLQLIKFRKEKAQRKMSGMNMV